MSITQSTTKIIDVTIKQTKQTLKSDANKKIVLFNNNQDNSLQECNFSTKSQFFETKHNEENEIYKIMFRHGVSQEEAKKILKRKAEAKKQRPSGIYKDQNGNPYGCDTGKSYKTKNGNTMTKQADGTYKDQNGKSWQPSVYERKEKAIQDIMEDLGVSRDEADRIYKNRRKMDKQRQNKGVYKDEKGNAYGCSIGTSYKTKSGITMTKQADGTYKDQNGKSWQPSVYEQIEQEINDIMYDLGVSRKRAEEIREQRKKQRKMGI